MIVTFDTKTGAYWLKRIKQNQTDQPVYGSFLLLSNDKGFSILTNVRKEEVNYATATDLKDHSFSDLGKKGNITVHFSFAPDGKVKIENAFDEKLHGELLLRMDNYLRLRDDEVYVSVTTPSGERTGKLVLQK